MTVLHVTNVRWGNRASAAGALAKWPRGNSSRWIAAMRVFHGFAAEIAPSARPKVTIGTFDGVHLGHQAVLRELIGWAQPTDCDALVITFERKPSVVLSAKPFEQITSLPHRLMLFERLGIDATLVLNFDQTLAALEPEAFVKEFLVGKLNATGVLLGHDSHFGRGARGDFDLLQRLAVKLGFETRPMSAVCVDGQPISSTRIREAITSGDLAKAEKMLGRSVSVLGTVIQGTGRGKEIGYPTANLDLHHEVRPPEGVYATQTLCDGVLYDSVTNIGCPPTLNAAGPAHISDEVVVETHLLGFSGSLYGKDLEVRFIDRIRAEETFRSAELLARRIVCDIEEARERLSLAAQGGRTPS